MVVDMFKCGIGNAEQTVSHLPKRIVDKMEVGTFPYALGRSDAAQAKDFATTQVLQGHLVAVQIARSTPQRLQFLCSQTFGQLSKGFVKEGELAGSVCHHMLTKKGLHLQRIVAGHHTCKQGIALFSTALTRCRTLVADKDDHDGHYNSHHCHLSAGMHQQCHTHTGHKGHTGCDEPAADDGEHTGDTENSTLTGPGSVCQTGSHSHHEGDKGGGKRKFQRCSKSNEQGCHHQVDRSTHQVIGRSFGIGDVRTGRLHVISLGNICGYMEPPVDCLQDAVGHHKRKGISQTDSSTHHGTCHPRRAEHLLTFCARREIDGCHHHLTGFLARSKGKDHYGTGTDEETDGGTGTFLERRHGECHRICAAGMVEIHKRSESRKGNTDEIHKVIARKSHGKGKSACKNHKTEYGIAPTADKPSRPGNGECLDKHHKQGKDNEASKQQQEYMAVEPRFHVGTHERHRLQSLEQHEVYNGCQCHTAEKTYTQTKRRMTAVKRLRLYKRKHNTRDILYQQSPDKSDGYADKDTEYHFHGLRRIEVVGIRSTMAADLQHRQGEGGSEEFEDHRHRSGGRHTETVEDIKQNDVGSHYSKENDHHVTELKLCGIENTVTCDVHHAI